MLSAIKGHLLSRCNQTDLIKEWVYYLSVCDACRYNEQKQKLIDWDERSTANNLGKYRKNNEFYDVLVPSSGGKDSATVYLLKHKYDMNPLAITWAQICLQI